MARAGERAVAPGRGRIGRIAAMAAALAVGLALALAGTARGAAELPPSPTGLSVAGGGEWRAVNDFDVSWVNPAGAQVIGAGWRVASDSFVGPRYLVLGLGIAAIDGIRLPGPGVWFLSVWLRDANGMEWERFGSTLPVRLDDVPPAVSFLPGDADDLPPQLVAVAADPLSGLAGATISYRKSDEEGWTALPTAIRAGALGTELVADTPGLEPGAAYELMAEASDRAGNVATTTMRADGAPMRLQAPEAPAGGGEHGEERRPRRTRLRVALAGGRRGDGRRRGATVAAGAPALLRGALSGPEGGLAGRRLRVVVRPARGSRGGRLVESLTTGPGGRFQLGLPPGPSRRLTVLFAGGEGLRAARRRLELRVRAAVSLRAAPRRLRTGGRLRLAGSVGSRGARVPRAGKLVTISYWEREARRWRPVIVTRTDRRGRFRAGYRFRYVTGRARIRLRARAPAEAHWPYAPGASRPVTVEVRGQR